MVLLSICAAGGVGQLHAANTVRVSRDGDISEGGQRGRRENGRQNIKQKQRKTTVPSLNYPPGVKDGRDKG